MRLTRRAYAAAALVAAIALLLAWLVLTRGPELPPDLPGSLVFVSDRDGASALYVRPLPRGRERRLTNFSEPLRDPAVSPDGARVAFSMSGRLGVVELSSGEVTMLTLGVDWKDAQPSWLPDGRRLVVSVRKRVGEPAALHLVQPNPAGPASRQPLTGVRGGDDLAPAVSPDGTFVVFVREDRLMRVSLRDGHVARLSGGFKRERSPRFLAPDRIVCAWSEGKRHGIDVIELATKGRRTLVEGGTYYRTLAPSRDGRFLAATRSFDAALPPLGGFFGQKEEIELLDGQGRMVALLEASRRHASHSPDWGR